MTLDISENVIKWQPMAGNGLGNEIVLDDNDVASLLNSTFDE